MLMGVGQAVALQPGVSRSGVTMTAGRFAGLDRDAAARIAFLMSVPITAGAVLFKALDAFGGDGAASPTASPPAFVWGIVASADHRLDRRVGHAAAGPHPHLHAVRRSTASCSASPCSASTRSGRPPRTPDRLVLGAAASTVPT